MKPILITIFFLFLINVVKGQTLCKSWYSVDANVCFTIDSTFSAKINELDKIKIKIKGDKFKLLWYNNETFFGWQKDVYHFNIEKLTNDTLIISQIPQKFMFEHLAQEKIVFSATLNGCEGKWKEKNE